MDPTEHDPTPPLVHVHVTLDPTPEESLQDIDGFTLLMRLQELVDALDRRIPHLEDDGERDIARDSAALRHEATERIAVLRGEEVMTGPVENTKDDASLPVSVCPLCHTVDLATSADALAAGADWTCTRCGQRWNAARLVTFAAFERYATGRAVAA